MGRPSILRITSPGKSTPAERSCGCQRNPPASPSPPKQTPHGEAVWLKPTPLYQGTVWKQPTHKTPKKAREIKFIYDPWNSRGTRVYARNENTSVLALAHLEATAQHWALQQLQVDPKRRQAGVAARNALQEVVHEWHRYHVALVLHIGPCISLEGDANQLTRHRAHHWPAAARKTRLK
eukprot:1195500-Prorocentrum_minimum.AAC.20